MPFQRTRKPLVLSTDEVKKSKQLSTSRTEPFARVERAQALLAYYKGRSLHGITKDLNITISALQRTIDRALAGGIEARTMGYQAPR